MKLAAAEPQREATFDLTPMIDVVFLLIVFFMLSSRFADATLTTKDLPQERGEATDAAAWKVVIDLNRDGILRVNGEQILASEIGDILIARGVDIQPETASGLVIRADRACRARHLNELAAQLTSLGIHDWGFTTLPDAGQ